MTDRIEKTIELKAPIERVWRALTDHEQFGAWFGVRMEGPFVPGETSRGKITNPGYDHLTMEVVTQALEPPRLFSYTWHPAALDPEVDYSGETPTLVAFRLESIDGGTRLTVTETGFDSLPAHRIPDVLRLNDAGWTFQMTSIERYLEQSAGA
jgi:uncharacterized protein YndB with AHSA1/START domain